jgi:hypothetical protein
MTVFATAEKRAPYQAERQLGLSSNAAPEHTAALHDRVSLAGDMECSLVEAIFCDIIEFTHRVTPSNA